MFALTACAAPGAGWVSSPLARNVIASPNFGDRRVSLIVLHHTGDPNFNSALDTLTRRGSEVSAHYLISRDGRIVQLVDERRRAWHAGVARWGPFDDVNSLSIGIELDNDGRSPFADPQIASLIALLHDLIKRYGIDPRNVVGHGDVAPGRKDDPSVMFPWDRLAAAGIGLWCAEPPADAEVALDEPATLQDIGYPINYESDAVAARAAFRRHFLGSEAIGPLSSHERAILLCIAHQQAETPRP